MPRRQLEKKGSSTARGPGAPLSPKALEVSTTVNCPLLPLLPFFPPSVLHRNGKSTGPFDVSSVTTNASANCHLRPSLLSLTTSARPFSFSSRIYYPAFINVNVC